MPDVSYEGVFVSLGAGPFPKFTMQILGAILWGEASGIQGGLGPWSSQLCRSLACSAVRKLQLIKASKPQDYQVNHFHFKDQEIDSPRRCRSPRWLGKNITGVWLPSKCMLLCPQPTCSAQGFASATGNPTCSWAPVGSLRCRWVLTVAGKCHSWDSPAPLCAQLGM